MARLVRVALLAVVLGALAVQSEAGEALRALVTAQREEAPTTVKPTTNKPTVKPTTAKPTKKPTRSPTTKVPTTQKPSTAKPTGKPTTQKPTKNPTLPPTKKPTKNPTLPPTKKPITSKPSVTSAPTRPPTEVGQRCSDCLATDVYLNSCGEGDATESCQPYGCKNLGWSWTNEDDPFFDEGYYSVPSQCVEWLGDDDVLWTGKAFPIKKGDCVTGLDSPGRKKLAPCYFSTAGTTNPDGNGLDMLGKSCQTRFDRTPDRSNICRTDTPYSP